MHRIFVSRNNEDQLHAKRLRQELEPYLGNNVEIKMSQDMPAGAVWKDWIKEELKQTDLLLFLIIDSNQSADWCLYELGMFTPLSDREPMPIVCIHPAGQEPPSQINDVQGVECEVEKIQGFLRDLFGGVHFGESINRKVAKDDNLLRDIAENLVGILTPENIFEAERVYYTRYISFDLKVAADKLDKIPPDCEVTGDVLSLEVFNLDPTQPGGKAWTWELFKPYFARTLEEAGSSPDAFFGEFERSILASCRGEIISPLQHYIRSLSSNKKYHPVIHRREFLGNNHLKIRVLFVQQPEPDTGERNYTVAAAPGE